jgi:HAD superfamily hydrolase (TIGR01490 family)
VSRRLDGDGSTTAAAAFFDLDRTLIRRSSTRALAGPLRRQGVITRRQLARSAAWHAAFATGRLNTGRVREATAAGLAALAGFSVDELREVVGSSLESVLRPLVYAEPLRLLETHRARGERVYIVSGSLQEIVERVADDLGFDGAIGSRCEIVDGRYTGRALRVALGEEKAAALRDLAAQEGHDLAVCTAYSDSISDLPFLEAVGRPVAANPDPALRRVARSRGWPVLEFTERATPAPPRPLPAAALAVPFVAGVWAATRRRAA